MESTHIDLAVATPENLTIERGCEPKPALYEAVPGKDPPDIADAGYLVVMPERANSSVSYGSPQESIGRVCLVEVGRREVVLVSDRRVR